MPWTHVVSPSVGLVTNVSPTTLPPGASPALGGVYLKQGQIITDYGFVNFPTPSATGTNQLLGTVMTIENFELTTGIEYLFCFTTSFIYNWNTTALTWNVINPNVPIDIGGDTWTASANVTSTNSTTIFLWGTASTSLAIASAFTTGVVGYKNFAAVNASATTLSNLSFWIYSTVAVAAGVFGIRLSAQNAGGTGAVYATYAVPALSAGAWTHCAPLLNAPVVSSGGFTPASLTAILSVSLIAISDPGTVTVYLNDIKAVRCFNGTPDNRWSFDVIYNTAIFTNGVDPVFQAIDASGPVVSPLVNPNTGALSLPTGTLQTSEIVRCMLDHVIFMNNTENGADVTQRVTWTNIGTTSDLLGGTAGYQDLTDNQDNIVAAELFSEFVMLIYKTNSVVAMTWVGGFSPFRFNSLIAGYGALSKDSVAVVEGYHIIMCGTNIYACNGGPQPQMLDTAVKYQLYSELNYTYPFRTFVRSGLADNEIEFYICYQQTTPDEAYVFNHIDTNWTIRLRNISGWGTYRVGSFITFAELVGPFSAQLYTFGSLSVQANNPITLVGDASGRVYQLLKSATMNGDNPITSFFETPDFVCPSSLETSWSGASEYQDRNMRLSQLAFEALGSSITVQYSTDGGVTWSPCQGGGQNIVTLTAIYQEYELFFETDAKKIRFQFSGGPFSLRYYGFNWTLRTGRR